MQGHRKLMTICAAAVLTLGLAACGGGGSDTADTMPPVVEPEPTPYETATAAIAAATTADAAQAAYDAVKDDVTAAQGAMLQAKVDARIAALATMDRAADQRMALMTAAGNVDTSDLMDAADIAAANTAIAALKAAIAAAVDVDDTSMYQGQVDAAETEVAAAQSRLDHMAQTAALSEAVTGLQAIDLTDLSTQAKIDAAEAAIAAVQAALNGATELSAAEKTAAMTELATANRTVMTAQGTFDTNAQMAALDEAEATLAALDLDNLMTQEQIDAAVAAITGLNLALEAATNLTDAQKRDAIVDMTVAQRKVDRAETTLADNVDSQRTALMEAVAALDMIDLDDLDTADKIAAAQAAVEALEAALNGATHLSDAEKATAMTELDTADEAVKMAQTGMDRDGRMMAQRTAITSAVTMARTAVAGVSDTSTDTEVAAADSAIAALKAAIEGAEDLPEGDADVASAQGTLTTLEGQLASAKTSRTAALEEADKETREAMAKTGKDLRLALGGTTANTNALDNVTASTLGTAGLGLTVADDAGTLSGTVTVPTLKAGDSAGSLGGWAGTNYAHTDTGTKVVNEARVYTNKGPDGSQPFSGGTNGKYTLISGETGATAVNNGRVLLTASGGIVPPGRARATAFTHTGTQTHSYDPATQSALIFRGTYDGAPGEFRCTGTCTSTNDGKDGPSALGGEWHFKPDSGAMVSVPDADYLYYGWWVSKDKDGKPTAASAFRGSVGTTPANSATPILLSDAVALTGSATYAGNAAGKFAISNPLDGTGSGGHFTADATLTAKFGPIAPDANRGGISGTIDNFMANGESVPWSVALHHAPWDTTGAFTSTSVATDTTANGTTWSIDGNSAPESGVWSGQMYDELPGLTTDTPAGDGNDTPTTATGTFYSEFSTIGRMVGAFGAEKQ